MKSFKTDTYELNNVGDYKKLVVEQWDKVQKIMKKNKQVQGIKQDKSFSSNQNLDKQEHIITKRLQRGEIIDLYLKKFHFVYQNPQEDSDYIPLNIRQSVFKDKLKNIRQQQITSNKKTRKNMLKKIIQKEQQNNTILVYKYFTIALLLFLIVINSVKLYLSHQTNTIISNEMNKIQLIGDNIVKFTSLLTNIYDFGFTYRGYSK